MSYSGISLFTFFRIDRLVQRTVDASVPLLKHTPDPGGWGWFNFLSGAPPCTGTLPVAPHAPPSSTLDAGPVDAVLASLLLVVGVFSLFTTLGPFKRTGEHGFPSIAWVCDLLSYVLPLLSFDVFAIRQPWQTAIDQGLLLLTAVQAAWQSREVQEKLVLTETIATQLAFGLLCFFWLRSALLNMFPGPRDERRTSAYWIALWSAGIVLYLGHSSAIGYLQVQWRRQVRPFRYLEGILIWQEDVSFAAYVWVVEITIIYGGHCLIGAFDALWDALSVIVQKPLVTLGIVSALTAILTAPLWQPSAERLFSKCIVLAKVAARRVSRLPTTVCVAAVAVVSQVRRRLPVRQIKNRISVVKIVATACVSSLLASLEQALLTVLRLPASARRQCNRAPPFVQAPSEVAHEAEEVYFDAEDSNDALNHVVEEVEEVYFDAEDDNHTLIEVEEVYLDAEDGTDGLIIVVDDGEEVFFDAEEGKEVSIHAGEEDGLSYDADDEDEDHNPFFAVKDEIIVKAAPEPQDDLWDDLQALRRELQEMKRERAAEYRPIRRGYNQVARDLRLGQSAVSIGLSLVTLFPVEPDDNEEAIVDGVDPWDEFDLLTSPPQPDSLPYPLDQQAVLDELLKDAVHAAGPDEEDEMLEMYQELRESLQRMREEGERDAEPILRESFAIGRELLCVREEMELSRLDVEIVLSSLSTLDGGKSIGPQISSAANANENIFQPIIPAPPTTDAVVLLPLSPSTLDDSTSWKSEFLGDVAMIAGTLEELEQAEQCTVVGEPEVEVERVASSEPQSSPSHVEPTSNLPVPSTSKDTASLISPASSSDSIVFPMCWRDDQSFLDDCARLARALEEVDEEEVERMLQTDARPAVPLPVLDPEANGALETGHHKPSEADEQAEDAGQPVNAEGSEEEGTAQEGTSEAEVEAIVLLRTQAAVDSPVFDVEDCSAFITPDFIPNLEATYPDSLADREYPCDDPSKGDDGESEVNNAKVEYERSLLSGRSLPENRTALSPIPEDPLEDGLPTHGSLDHLHACYQSKEWLPLLDIEPPSSEEADLGTDDGPLPATYQPEPDGEGDDGMLDMEIEEEDYGQIYSIYVGISIQSAVNTAAAETIASPSSVQQSSFNRSTTAVETPPHPCSSVEEKGKMVKVPPVTSLMAPYREQPSEANLPHSPRTEMPTHGSLEHIRTASWSKGILRLAHVATPLNSLPVSCSFP